MGNVPKQKTILTKHFRYERFFSQSSLLPWLLLIALAPLLIATIFTYEAAKETVQAQVEERLSHIAEEKVYQFENYIAERKSDISELALSPEVLQLVHHYKATSNPLALQKMGKENLGYYLNISSQGYADIYLASPQGEIWYSTNKSVAAGENIQQIPVGYNQLAKIFDEANTLMSIQLSSVETDENKAIRHFYLATPVFENGRIAAILILSLPSERIRKALTAATNLGQSGETLMGPPTGNERIISSKKVIDTTTMNYFENSKMGEILREAGWGTSGYGELTDQNRIHVLAAWQYLPSLGWGILAKMNIAEAFAPIGQLRRQLYLLTALTLGLVILLARLIASNIRRAEERTEQLLLNILPVTIAERLKQGERTIADNFEATVLFTDIVGFTELSKEMRPENVVEFLNNIFSGFDLIIENSHAEKIKTIGDSYMLVSGLPDPNPNHAKNVIGVALAMKQKLAEYNIENNTHFQMRTGIASGAVTAGIVGFKKFSYDVWGNTVNTASRMESQSLPDQIQVAESTYLLLKDDYHFEKRGEIAVKGMGIMTTYFLLGAKEKQSQNETRF